MPADEHRSVDQREDPNRAREQDGAEGSDASSETAREAASESGIADLPSELSRRNVFKVAGIYLALSWLAVQIVTTLEAPLSLPDWADTLTVVFVALGFPFACILAWAYELSPEGLRRTQPLQGRSKRLRRQGLVPSVIAVLVIVFGGVWIAWERPFGIFPRSDPSEATADELRSIAVLPFANLSAGVDDGFGDGLTVDIIHVLASTGAFRIPGFTSSLQYKDRAEDLRTIGQTLDVEYIIEGTIRRSDETVRIEAHLIRAENGFMVWSGTFREELDNVFVVQERVAQAIGEALSIPLEIDTKGLEKERVTDPQAYAAFLRGHALFEQRGEALARSIKAFEHAVELEPDFAAAWAALSMAYNVAPSYNTSLAGLDIDPSVYFAKGRNAALRARDLDPDEGIVQQALGNLYNLDRNWAASETAYLRALNSDPANVSAMQDFASLLLTVGKEDDALRHLNRAMDLDPANQLYLFMIARVDWQRTRSPDDMATMIEMFRNTPPMREVALRMILTAYVQDGRLSDARDIVTACTACPTDLRNRALSLIDAVGVEPVGEIFERYKDDSLLSYQFLYEIGGADIVLDAFEYVALQSSYAPRSFRMPWSLVDEIGATQRFQDIVTEMGLVDYWQIDGWPPLCRPSDDSEAGLFSCGSRA